ncbi:MAG TPA: hypothetical protein VD837_07165, partial [Terriglobales bacterium]|nr:hypothetical protein [Terriglobales bacterium]
MAIAPSIAPLSSEPVQGAKIGAIPVSVMLVGDRRMEAETYLSSGYGIRTAIESKPVGWQRLSNLARSWQPSRLKGIQVSRRFGTPFLTATQVFDVRPIPRKWLALAKTSQASDRFVPNGTILVTCSGSVGRPTLAGLAHKDILISHDILRVEALEPTMKGWIYAFLLSPQAREMMRSVHYGHMIKHLETSHLDALPVPCVDDSTAADFAARVATLVNLRNRGHQLTIEAEQRFQNALGSIDVSDWGEAGFTVAASQSFQGRRRLDAANHNPGAEAIYKFLAKHGKGFTTLPKAGYDVWVPGRYKRIPSENGVIYRDSADLLEVNPDLPKRYADCTFGDEHKGRVKEGWILVACSGQVYGIIGTA